MKMCRGAIVLAMFAVLAVSALAEADASRRLLADAKPATAPTTQAAAAPKKPQQQPEAGQKKNGGSSGPDSWQFWQQKRQLLSTGTNMQQAQKEPAKKEVGQRTSGGSSGPNSWQFWKAQRQLLADPAAPATTTATKPAAPAKKSINERGGGSSGPDSWQFWKNQRQLLADGNAADAGPQTKTSTAAAAAAPKKQPEAGAATNNKAAADGKAAPSQQPQKGVNERGAGSRSTGYGGWWSGGTAYPMQNGNIIMTTAGWGGGKPRCAGAGLANSCVSKKKH